MKKIMFNDNFHLTQTVLDGTKKITRRIIKAPRKMRGIVTAGYNVHLKYADGKLCPYDVYARDEQEIDIDQILPKYEIGEVVAIAQNYKTIDEEIDVGDFTDPIYDVFIYHRPKLKDAGWSNKMFVKADLMPHHIKITDIRIERLQDIPENDIYKEGVNCLAEHRPERKIDRFLGYCWDDIDNLFKTPREAFTYLIDKISGKGTWDSNPYVFVYEFTKID